MVCKQCGNSVKSDFKYCPYCGERMLNDFHDQFHDLTPPFVIHDIPENEEDLYGEPLEELPVFDLPEEPERGRSFSAPENPLDYEIPPQTYKRGPAFTEPERTAYDRPQPPYMSQAEPGFDDSEQDYRDLEDAPYIVYHPDGSMEPPRPAQPSGMAQRRRNAEPPQNSAEKMPRIPAAQEPPAHSGMGIGMKLAAILVTLMLAGGISVIGYRLLTPDQPFSHPAEDGASFASVLRI